MKNCEYVVSSEHAGLRLDAWLAQNDPTYSRSLWTKVIESGSILLNQEKASRRILVKEGDVVEVCPNELLSFTEQTALVPEKMNLNWICNEEHYGILYKPAGLVVHPGAGVHSGTVAHGLVQQFPGNQELPNWGLIHRLDKDTSGVMVIAKTLEGYCALNSAMLEREIHRKYLALIWGELRRNQTITSYLARDPQNRLKRKSSPHPEFGKIAITHLSTVAKYGSCSLVECRLETGRTHQIRVHCESIGHPIIGEQLYSKHPVARSLFHRQALHAVELSFWDPWREEDRIFNADLPEDFRALLEQFETKASQNNHRDE